MFANAKKGQSLQEIYTAEWYNKINRNPSVRTGIGGYQLRNSSVVVPAIRDSGSSEEINRFDAVAINNSALTVQTEDTDELYDSVAVQITKDAGLEDDNLAIAQGPFPDAGDGGNVVAVGLTWANLYVNDLAHEYAVVNPNGERLESAEAGIARIVAKDPDYAADQESTALILLRGGGSGASTILAKTPPAGIPGATGDGPYTWGTALCHLVSPSDGEVSEETINVSNIVSVAIGGNVVIKAEKVGEFYFVDVADCPEGPPTGPVEPGQAQPLTIEQPPDGIGIALALPGLVTFESSIVDLLDGDISGNTQWESSIDGVLGTGSPVQLTITTAGTHTITARVTNSSNNESTATIQLPVTDGPPPP